VDLLDASALIALLNDEIGASDVERVIANGDVGATTVQLAEVVDVLARRHGVAPDKAQRAVDAIPGLSVIAVGAGEGWRAGELRARHYRRTACPVSLADCVLVAAARQRDRIVTSDRALAAVSRAEGFGVMELPPPA
jgi:PIN domain nuclease of toxin-antitoxin system